LGKHGATFIELKFVTASILKDAIKHAYNNVAPASLIKIKTGAGRK